jgi:signal transduction histidine kinase
MKETSVCKANEPSKVFLREVQIEYLIHELKDPLAVAEVGVQSVLERQSKFGVLSSRQERTLKRSLRNMKKARTMLYDLLEIGRSEAGCFSCCRFMAAESLYETLLDSLEVMADAIADGCRHSGRQSEALAMLASNGIKLEIDPESLEMEIEQDEIKFRQIVGNLIKNGFHHRKKQIEIRMRQDHRHLLIEVGDDGPGIAAEDHEKIFQRYTQLSQTSSAGVSRLGHGLGLTGSRILARKLGGDIEVVSQPKQGALFRFTLPVAFETGN